ncbi:transposase [bacterium]|nr:transposase [FCB group bacterium]MBL7191419.1 transposase [bacterium]
MMIGMNCFNKSLVSRGLVLRQILRGDNSPTIKMKKIRLDKETYCQRNRPCAITICSKNRITIFNNKDFVHEIMAIIRKEADLHRIQVFAFCIMPDHLHLLISTTSDCSLVDWIALIKGKITRQSWNYGFKDTIFQKSFYDHFLRKEDDLFKQVRYILENPLRKGLSEVYSKFPYIGSFVFDLSDY